MKRSLASHSSGSDLAQAFRCANLSLMSRLNILIYLFQVKADYLGGGGPWGITCPCFLDPNAAFTSVCQPCSTE